MTTLTEGHGLARDTQASRAEAAPEPGAQGPESLLLLGSFESYPKTGWEGRGWAQKKSRRKNNGMISAMPLLSESKQTQKGKINQRQKARVLRVEPALTRTAVSSQQGRWCGQGGMKCSLFSRLQPCPGLTSPGWESPLSWQKTLRPASSHCPG